MSKLPASSQWKIEAERIVQGSDHAIQEADRIPVTELIGPPDPTTYDMPDFIDKVASRESKQHLVELLAELRAINDQFIGQPVREVEVYLATTGNVLPLLSLLQEWAKGYLQERIAIDNPCDRREPPRKWLRLHNEINDVLRAACSAKNTVNYVFLSPAAQYAYWYLFYEVVSQYVAMNTDGEWVQLADSPGSDLSWGYFASLWQGMDITPYRANALAHFIGQHMQASGFRPDAQNDPAAIVDLIQQMRPYLVNGYRIEDNAVPFGTGRLLWNWTTNSGIGHIVSRGAENRPVRGA